MGGDSKNSILVPTLTGSCVSTSVRSRRGSLPSKKPGAPLFSSIPPWQRERARRVQDICRRLDARVQRGEKLSPVTRRFARRWLGKTYASDPGRPVRFSAARIRSLYYQWRASDRSAAAILLHYKQPNRKLPADLVLAFVRVCLSDESIRSLAAGHAKLNQPPGSASSLYHALPADVGPRLIEILALRRKAKMLAGRLAKVIGRREQTLRKGARS